MVHLFQGAQKIHKNCGLIRKKVIRLSGVFIEIHIFCVESDFVRAPLGKQQKKILL